MADAATNAQNAPRDDQVEQNETVFASGYPRDGQTATSSTGSYRGGHHRAESNRRRADEPAVFHEVHPPPDADATTVALFAAINNTNLLLFTQGERLHVLEASRRSPRRHRRPDSWSSSPRRHRSRTPPRKTRRDDSRSPTRRSRGRGPVTERDQEQPKERPQSPPRRERGANESRRNKSRHTQTRIQRRSCSRSP